MELEINPQTHPTTMPATATHKISSVLCVPALFNGDGEHSFQPGDKLIINQVDVTIGDYNVLWMGANPSECITKQFWLTDKKALEEFEAILADKWLFRKDTSPANDADILYRAVYYLIDKTPEE